MLNFPLAVRLAIQNLRHHLIVSAATVMGVAIGMTVVGAILIVDNNTRRSQDRHDNLLSKSTETQFRPNAPADAESAMDRRPNHLSHYRVSFVRQAEPTQRRRLAFPTQEGQLSEAGSSESPSTRRGEEDYQAMRLAVRLASLLAFSIGTVIVFYTMRFSVASRRRAMSLLLCLGESASNIGISLLVEALILGSAGTILGVAMALPAALFLLELGISTTGQAPVGGFAIPWSELGIMVIISITISLLGCVGPLRSLQRMQVAAVLQPRFLSEEDQTGDLEAKDILWVIPPMLAATYLMVRSFLISWFSVFQFFLIEAFFVISLAIMTLWWVKPLLRMVLRIFETMLNPFFPLETLLTGRRMRLTSRKIAFAVAGVTLVFSLLTGLHNITLSIKEEIRSWAAEAVFPYV